jgi:hypothetical protein
MKKIGKKSTNSKTKLKDLYSNYRTYCFSGQRALHNPILAKDLIELGFEIQQREQITHYG